MFNPNSNRPEGMSMFNKPLDVANLSIEHRTQLGELYAVREELAMRSIEANRLKGQVVRDPCEATQAELEEYLDTFVRPLARRQEEIQATLRKSLLDKDELKKMLPMILAMLNKVFDLRLFIEVTGLDLESGHPIVKMLEEIMNSDLPSS